MVSLARPRRMRRPIGSSPGQAWRASSSVITTTSGAAAVSLSDSNRPFIRRTPSSLRYSGVTTRWPVIGTSFGFSTTRPSTVKKASNEPRCRGMFVVMPALVTPGISRTEVTRRSRSAARRPWSVNMRGGNVSCELAMPRVRNPMSVSRSAAKLRSTRPLPTSRRTATAICAATRSRSRVRRARPSPVRGPDAASVAATSARESLRVCETIAVRIVVNPAMVAPIAIVRESNRKSVNAGPNAAGRTGFRVLRTGASHAVSARPAAPPASPMANDSASRSSVS